MRATRDTFRYSADDDLDDRSTESLNQSWSTHMISLLLRLTIRRARTLQILLPSTSTTGDLLRVVNKLNGVDQPETTVVATH